MPRRGLCEIAVGGLLCGLILAACSTGAAPSAPVALSTPRPVPAHAIILLGLNTGSKPGLNLSASVGGAATRNFLLDTGSTGLWVYASAIGRYTATRYAVTNSYGSGLMYEGILVYTTVDFGNGLKTARVPVALVERATCVPGVKSCPATPNDHNCPGVKPGPNAGIRCLESGRKLFGTFGAALSTKPIPSDKPVTELYNVLFGIAQPWAASFIVTPQALEIGPYATGGFKMVPMTRESPAPARPMPSGAQGWERDVTLCFSVARLRNYCSDALFDTGATNIDFQAVVKLPLVPTQCPGTGRVKTGTRFEMRTQDGTLLGKFDTGKMANWNVVGGQLPMGRPQVNTGLTFYNRDEVLFDAAEGRVGLRRLATPGQTARTGCGAPDGR